jgi:hypothetical protein
LLLTRVKRTVEGDAFFPAFEHHLERAVIIRETPEMCIERHLSKMTCGRQAAHEAPTCRSYDH